MKTCHRIATLALAAACGLAAAPTRGADATLERDGAAVALTGAERWPLRSTRTPPLPAPPRPERSIAMSDLPNERRTVRIVYEGYREAGPVSADR